MRLLNDKFLLGLLVLALTFVSLSWSTTSQAEHAAKADPQAERFAALEKTMSNCVLVGHFAVTGKDDTTLQAERYELKTVKHQQGENWLFEARIVYGENDVTLPLVLPVRWAGDTPVISVDKMMFPGLGTYTARVMIYADHYAGFWSGGDHGGHLFGVIKRGEEAKEK